MYRNSPESKKQPEMYSNLWDLHNVNVKCIHEIFLDTYQALNTCSTTPNSYNVSPTSSTGTSTSNCMLSPLTPSQTSSGFCSSSSSSCSSPSPALQQQRLIAVHQQHLAAAATAKRQLELLEAASAASTGTNGTSQKHQDEISKSLKMFASLTAYTNGHESSANAPPQLPQSSSVDAVMQDFACNGYISDELNRYQLGMHLSNVTNSTASSVPAGIPNTTSLLTAAVNHHHNVNNSETSTNAAAAALSQQQQLQQHNINLNVNNNFWKMLPPKMQKNSHGVTTAVSATATATAAANIDHNSNPRKVSKRYNGAKNEKYTSAKHCVFCENNNEPEAVVKSHSVRDSLGRVLCPKLRTYVCPICKASGDLAHTIKYCPQKPIITMEDAMKAESYRLAKGTYYKQQNQYRIDCIGLGK